MAEKRGWVYVMTNKPRGTLYVGVSAELSRRVYEHREGVSDGFTKRYELKLLVYAERPDSIEAAIQRETRIKKWPRAWKIELIRSMNPIGAISTEHRSEWMARSSWAMTDLELSKAIVSPQKIVSTATR